MYKQLTSEQRSQVFTLLQRKSPRKEIAHIVGISQSTLSRELKRNGSPSDKYVWFKAHDKAMERSTNMLFMTKLPHGKKSGPLAREVRRLLPYRKHIKTITTDNGPGFAAHKLITQYLGAVVYFADPYASWQKGAVENTNKLIRQYIPKQANFDDFTDRKIAMIQKKINRRPRQKLNFQTPKCEFYKRIL
ncbi:IS30 family transposase [Prevotella nigrescens]|uniref:IS30 family transposase n=1 Tax=Prevotella nigrescens TaxID=28133 RepID=UPI001C5ED473|nr:IS30 family transposase [Prevotella nigrescens]MBW4725762.1 IS30 family transposase [Prevotella nigrescens]